MKGQGHTNEIRDRTISSFRQFVAYPLGGPRRGMGQSQGTSARVHRSGTRRSRRKKTGSPLGSHTQCRGAGGGGSGESEFGVHSVMAQFVQRSGLTSCSMRATWRATASGAGSSKQLMSGGADGGGGSL